MRSLGTMVRERLQHLRITQKELALRLGGVDESQLSKVLKGERPAPSEDAAMWCVALELKPQQAHELTLAMHLTTASPYVAEVVDRTLTDLAELRALVVYYETRVAKLDEMVSDLALLRGAVRVPRER
jgi:transcriptional regulator with XRE-family HTH domain